MKTKTMFTIFFLTIVFMTSTVKAQPENYIWKYQGQKKERTIGLYGGLSYNYAEVMSKPSGYLGYKAGVVINRKFGIGFAGAALNYDRQLNELSEFGTYRLEAGYAGMFVEYIQPIGNRVRLNFFVVSAAGIARYKYDKQYAEELIWYEEVIDQDEYAVFEPGMECNVRIANKWWVGVNGSLKTTSPLDLTGTSENMLEGFSGGITVKYGIF